MPLQGVFGDLIALEAVGGGGPHPFNSGISELRQTGKRRYMRYLGRKESGRLGNCEAE